MKSHVILAAIFALSLCAASIHALDAITVEQGESLTITSDVGPRAGTVSEIAVVYRIDSIGFRKETVLPEPKVRSITQQVSLDVPPGVYIFNTDLYVNKKLTRTTELLVTVNPAGTPPYTVPPTSGNGNPRGNNTTSRPLPPNGDGPTVLVPSIPDVEAGTTIVLPITIQGTGHFDIYIPQLSFATYEVPESLDVKGEASFPLLLHIENDAAPGTYAIPIFAGTEQTSARIRIIKYRETSSMWLLVPLGIIIVIVGILILFQRSRQKPYQDPQAPRPPRDPATGDELISYY